MPPSRITLFGATGRVGRMLLDLAIADGHEVTALVRDPAKLSAKHARLTVRPGDALDPPAVRDAVRGATAVLGALGLPRDAAGEPAGEDPALSTSMANIAAAMQDLGVKRLVAIAGAGILQDPRTGALSVDAEDYPPALVRFASEHRRVYETLRASSLEWTLVCPPRMPSGMRTGRYRTAVDKLPEGGTTVSAEDVAAFTYSALTRDAFVGKRVGIAY